MTAMAIDRSRNTRKILTLPHELVARVRKFRFRREIDTETEAYRVLIAKGLEGFGEEEAESEPPSAPAQPPLRVRRPKG